jgi:NTE family protein
VTHQPHTHTESDDRQYRHQPIGVDMILASASIPLLFDPVRVDGAELWDGGLLVNTPIAPTVALGAELIIPVLVTAGRGGADDGPLSLGLAIERLADAFLENAYNTDRKLLLERNKLAFAIPERELRQATLYEAIRPGSSRAFNAGSYLYFERDALLEMYEAGRRAARAWLARGPRLDTHPGPEPADEHTLASASTSD